jgi:hypothetical protein
MGGLFGSIQDFVFVSHFPSMLASCLCGSPGVACFSNFYIIACISIFGCSSAIANEVVIIKPMQDSAIVLNRICLSFNNVIERNRLQSTDNRTPSQTSAQQCIAQFAAPMYRLGFSNVINFHGTHYANEGNSGSDTD